MNQVEPETATGVFIDSVVDGLILGMFIISVLSFWHGFDGNAIWALLGALSIGFVRSVWRHWL